MDEEALRTIALQTAFKAAIQASSLESDSGYLSAEEILADAEDYAAFLTGKDQNNGD